MLITFVVLIWVFLVMAVVLDSYLMVGLCIASVLVSLGLVIKDFSDQNKKICENIKSEGFNVIQKGSKCYIETSTGLYFLNGTNGYYTKEDLK